MQGRNTQAARAAPRLKTSCSPSSAARLGTAGKQRTRNGKCRSAAGGQESFSVEKARVGSESP